LPARVTAQLGRGEGHDVIERLVVTLILAMVVLWVVGWLLTHLGLIFVAGLSFAAWAWWRSRNRA
jgi:uncharacterized protein HemY